MSIKKRTYNVQEVRLNTSNGGGLIICNGDDYNKSGAFVFTEKQMKRVLFKSGMTAEQAFVVGSAGGLVLDIELHSHRAGDPIVDERTGEEVGVWEKDGQQARNERLRLSKEFATRVAVGMFTAKLETIASEAPKVKAVETPASPADELVQDVEGEEGAPEEAAEPTSQPAEVETKPATKGAPATPELI
jgi:hypothetical protein